jgi:hypothetical protein
MSNAVRGGSEVVPITHTGYLRKKGQNLKNWKRRFIVVELGWEHFFHNDIHVLIPLSSFSLRHIHVLILLSSFHFLIFTYSCHSLLFHFVILTYLSCSLLFTFLYSRTHIRRLTYFEKSGSIDEPPYGISLKGMWIFHLLYFFLDLCEVINNHYCLLFVCLFVYNKRIDRTYWIWGWRRVSLF